MNILNCYRKSPNETSDKTNEELMKEIEELKITNEDLKKYLLESQMSKKELISINIEMSKRIDGQEKIIEEQKSQIVYLELSQMIQEIESSHEEVQKKRLQTKKVELENELGNLKEFIKMRFREILSIIK
jgi:hypothetical protein